MDIVKKLEKRSFNDTTMENNKRIKKESTVGCKRTTDTFLSRNVSSTKEKLVWNGNW